MKISDDDWNRIWWAISDARDKYTRTTNDADTDEITDAVVKVVESL